MPFCPNCGNEVGKSRFCDNCGLEQGAGGSTPRPGPPGSGGYQPQTVRVTSGHQYDSGICLLLCCCLSPVAALIYYLLTDHPEEQYSRRY